MTEPTTPPEGPDIRFEPPIPGGAPQPGAPAYAGGPPAAPAPGAVPPAPAPAGSAGGPTMPDITDLVQGSRGRPEKAVSTVSVGRGVLIGGVIAALVLVGGAFVAGKAMASGPKTLADAVQQAGAGTLPCGDAGTGAGGFIARLCTAGGAGATGGPGTGGLGTPGQGQAGGPGGFARGVAGTVTAVTGTSITVATRAGDVTVAVPAGTPVSKTVSGSVSDVTVGSSVTITSTTDASGNRTASRVTLVPAGTIPTGAPGDDQPPAAPSG